jgi:O-methyltransferase/methyltransferase family protein
MTADTSEAVWRLAIAFRSSRAIGAAVELGIPEYLSRHPHTAAQLARDTGTHEPSLLRLLRTLVALELLSEDDSGRFALTASGEEMRADRLGPLIRFLIHDLEWRSWGRLDYSIKTGKRAFDHVHGMRNWDYFSSHPEEAAIFDTAMHAMTEPVADGVARAYDFTGIETIADIGGGDGTMLIAILRAHPHLRGILFDRPHVLKRAEAHTAELAERIELVGGSFFESVPQADAYLMKSILHDWEDDDAVTIVKRCREAGGAKLLVVERLLSEKIGPRDLGALLSDLNMLVNPGGRERTVAEYTELFQRGGYRYRRTIDITPQFHILEAGAV